MSEERQVHYPETKIKVVNGYVVMRWKPSDSVRAFFVKPMKSDRFYRKIEDWNLPEHRPKGSGFPTGFFYTQ